MKIISLNTWGGRAGNEELLSFFEKYKEEIDIFCLQEIWSAPHENLDGHNAGGVPIDHGKILVHGMQEISKVQRVMYHISDRTILIIMGL
jgi:exonuclease III